MILTSARERKAEVREHIVLGLYTVQYNRMSKKESDNRTTKRRTMMLIHLVVVCVQTLSK